MSLYVAAMHSSTSVDNRLDSVTVEDTQLVTDEPSQEVVQNVPVKEQQRLEHAQATLPLVGPDDAVQVDTENDSVTNKAYDPNNDSNDESETNDHTNGSEIHDNDDVDMDTNDDKNDVSVPEKPPLRRPQRERKPPDFFVSSAQTVSLSDWRDRVSILLPMLHMFPSMYEKIGCAIINIIVNHP